MLGPTSPVSHLFDAAGWQKQERCEPSQKAVTAPELAKSVIVEFGGLQVGSTGADKEQAASNVHFYPVARPEVSIVVEAWRSQFGQLCAVATAHNEHIIIFVGGGGKYYAFTDPDEQLYSIGQTFGEAMERLLLGLSFGSPIGRDA